MRQARSVQINRRLIFALPLLAISMFVSGCNAGVMNGATQRFFVRKPNAQPSAQVASAAPASPDNRLLLQGDDGNIYIISADGKERFALTTDASMRRIYSQPTWSADGKRVAWSRLDSSGSALITSQFDGSDQVTLKVPFLPFYINWSPTGDQLAYLSNWQVVDEPSIALRLVDVGGAEDKATTLVDGQPLYFSWAPDGSRMLTHVAGERVELQSVGGDQTSIVLTGSAFSAPQWSTTGDRLLYAASNASTQQLLLSDVDGKPVQELTIFDGRITFSESLDAKRVAYALTDAGIQANTLGPLYVVETESLRTVEITDRPVVAFYWSPDSRALAYITLDTINGRLAMRWNIWDGTAKTAYAAFVPSRTFLGDYLPFFDQYAQSHRIWSPASDAFVFPGTLENGQRGIWVQKLRAGEKPVMIAPGEYASWSPRSDGGSIMACA